MVTAGNDVFETTTLDWAVGSLPVKWTFSNGVTTVNCAQAGVTSMNVNFRDSAGNLVYGNNGTDVPCVNGNGRQGAAAATAARVSHRGYRISGVANAPSSDFTRSLVMYRKGFEGEGRRLARDLEIRIVGPLDGLRAAQLHGAHAVVVVGA